MTLPQRIQRKRTKGWRMPVGAVYVGRPTKWGNPFRIGEVADRVALTTPKGVTVVKEIRVETPAQAVEFYRRWLNGTPLLVGGHDLAPHPPTIAQIRAELTWLDLACWCPLDAACHADTLMALANSTVGVGL